MRILTDDLEGDYVSLLPEGGYILTSRHPVLTDVYSEITKCAGLKKDSLESLEKVKRLLLAEGFSNEGQHVQTNIMLRDHSRRECVEIMEAWWHAIAHYSKRDQTSFNYAVWKCGGEFSMVPWEDVSARLFTTDYMHQK